VAEDDLLELRVNLRLLPEDNITLAPNRGLLELRVLEYIGQDLNRLANIVLKGLSIVNGVLPLEFQSLIPRITCRIQ